MKKLSVLFIILFITLNLPGYTCWEENGKAIRKETHLNYSQELINLSSGGYMLLWSDASSGLQEMKVQKLSEEGESIWDEPISLSECDLYLPNGEKIIEASDGNIITAWYELDDPALIRCQKIDQDGNKLWGDDGLTFALDFYTDDCFLLETVADLNGGVYIVYNEDSIKALNIDSDGDIGENWNSTGNTIFTDIAYSDLEVIPDGYGGFVISARGYSSSTILMQRLNIAAENLWGDEGLSITGTYDLKISNWETGVYAIVYRDSEEEVFKTTLLNSDGEFLLAEPQTIGLQMQEGYIHDWTYTRSSDGKLIIVFSDNNYGASDYVLVAQKLEIGGEPDWGENGIIVHSNNIFNCSYTVEDIFTDENGGFFLASEYWDEDIEGIMYDHLDSDGSLINSEFITETALHQHGSPIFLENSNNNCSIFWNLKEEGFQRIKMQIMDEDDNPVFVSGGNTVFEVIAGNVGTAYLSTSGTNTAILWGDSRFDEYTTFIQLLDNETGETIFEDQGLAVNDLSEADQSYPQVAFNESGELICVCYHCNDYYDLQIAGAQIIDLSGNLLLGENGLIFGDLPVVFDQISLGRSGNDFLISWSERSNDFIHPDTFLKVQRINESGALWGDGVIIRSGIDNECTGITIENDYIFWKEGDIPPDLYVIKLNENGEPAPGWDMEGICLTQATFYQNDYYVYPNDDEILVLWYQNSTNHTYLYAQLVSEDGNLLWGENGVQIGCDLFNIQSIDFFDYNLYISTWDNSPDNMEIRKYDLEGNSIWQSPIVITSFPYSPRFDLKISDDVIIAYWTDENYNIRALLYDQEGNLIENVPPDGIDICSAIHSQYLSTSIIDDNDNSIVVWGDARGKFMPASDPSIYVQKIDLSTVPVTEEDIPDGNLVNLSNYPNPFTQSTILKCDLPRGIENAEIVIYNIRGQKVRSLPATTNDVEWDCRNQDGNLAGSGVYFYVLQGKNLKSETGKMIMLR